MKHRADLRPVLAAGAMLAVLASSYEVARRSADAASARQANIRRALARATAKADSVAAVAARVAAQARLPTPTDTVAGCNSGPLRWDEGNPAARRPWLVSRYVGMVGGEPVTVLLWGQRPDSLSGSFYYHRAGVDYLLQPAAGSQRGRPWLTVRPQDQLDGNVGQWRLQNRPGAAVIGTWRGGGRPQAIVLREDYAGAVRLTIETTRLTGGWTDAWERSYEGCPNAPVISHEFLHLPRPAGVLKALRPLLSPNRAARRHAIQLSRSASARVAVGLIVRLNDFGLLSYETTTEYYHFSIGRTYYECVGSPLIDLVGGQTWPLARLLQPSYGLPLRRLAARHLLRDAKFQDVEWKWQQLPAPPTARDTAYSGESWRQRDLAPRPDSWVLTGAGLELTYSYESLGGLNAAGDDTVLIPYAELRPLVRPGTPLARMLAARGMW